jgi:hypothetical protein
MRSACAIFAALALCACSQAGSSDDPRAREGETGPLTWRIVSQTDGQAAFLSRPGAAPDLVLWCRSDGQVTLRAHVFESPTANPDLTLDTDGGTVAFQNVRRQGGVRETDRKLVEGSVISSDGKLPQVLMGATNLTLRSGDVSYRAENTDSSGVLPAFTAACTQTSPDGQTGKNK